MNGTWVLFFSTQNSNSKLFAYASYFACWRAVMLSVWRLNRDWPVTRLVRLEVEGTAFDQLAESCFELAEPNSLRELHVVLADFAPIAVAVHPRAVSGAPVCQIVATCSGDCQFCMQPAHCCVAESDLGIPVTADTERAKCHREEAYQDMAARLEASVTVGYRSGFQSGPSCRPLRRAFAGSSNARGQVQTSGGIGNLLPRPAQSATDPHTAQ